MGVFLARFQLRLARLELEGYSQDGWQSSRSSMVAHEDCFGRLSHEPSWSFRASVGASRPARSVGRQGGTGEERAERWGGRKTHTSSVEARNQAQRFWADGIIQPVSGLDRAG